jgi:hypothetical protein
MLASGKISLGATWGAAGTRSMTDIAAPIVERDTPSESAKKASRPVAGSSSEPGRSLSSLQWIAARKSSGSPFSIGHAKPFGTSGMPPRREAVDANDRCGQSPMAGLPSRMPSAAISSGNAAWSAASVLLRCDTSGGAALACHCKSPPRLGRIEPLARTGRIGIAHSGSRASQSRLEVPSSTYTSTPSSRNLALISSMPFCRSSSVSASAASAAPAPDGSLSLAA